MDIAITPDRQVVKETHINLQRMSLTGHRTLSVIGI